MSRPKSRKRWSRLSPKERNRLHYRRAKWRAQNVTVNRTSAAFVKNVRKLNGWSQTDLAKRLCVSLRSVKRWESGSFMPTGKVKKWLVKQCVS